MQHLPSFQRSNSSRAGPDSGAVTGLLILASLAAVTAAAVAERVDCTQKASSDARSLADRLRGSRLGVNLIFCDPTSLSYAQIVCRSLPWPTAVVCDAAFGPLSVLSAGATPSDDRTGADRQQQATARLAMIDAFRLKVLGRLPAAKVLVIGSPQGLNILTTHLETPFLPERGFFSPEGGEIVAYEAVATADLPLVLTCIRPMPTAKAVA